MGVLIFQGTPASQVLPPKRVPQGEADSLAQAFWYSTWCCHVLVGLGRWSESLHGQAAYGVSSHLTLNWAFWDQDTQHVADAELPLSCWEGTSTFTLTSCCGARHASWRPSFCAEWTSATAWAPRCSDQGPQGTRPSRIDGLLVTTRSAALLRAARCSRAEPY